MLPHDEAPCGRPGDGPGDRPPALSVLRVLDGSGDRTVQWDRDRLAAGDPEAQAAVREAERIFAQARARGARAFRVLPGRPAERLDQLDPQADQTIVIPPMVGG